MANTKQNKNSKALFSVICLCIIALGLIVYFSTQSANNNTVNEATTVQDTTDVQKRVTNVTETTTAVATTKETTTQKPTTTQKTTMDVGSSNTPYKSFYKYPISEVVAKGYSEDLAYDKTMGDYRAHPAVDFKGEKGCKVVAINDGLVTNVYTDNLYGIVVEIDHGGKLVAKYCGLDSVSVKKGDMVQIGNTVGTLGKIAIEADEGYHLHFETKLDGKFVNPLDAMSKTE